MNICAFFHGVFLKHDRPFGHNSLPRLEQHEGELTIYLKKIGWGKLSL